jgi:hypothetical protein
MINVSRYAKLSRISNAVAAGVTTVTSSAVDMKGFDAVTFIVAFGAIVAAGVQSVKIQQSNDTSGSPDDYSDLAGSSVTVADDDDNQLVVVEVAKPQKRFLKCIVLRTVQNSTVDSIVALQSSAGVEPVTHDTAATVVAAKFLLAPAEGTA